MLFARVAGPTFANEGGSRQYWPPVEVAEMELLLDMLWWHWIVLGLVLAALEMAGAGGFFIIFFGVGRHCRRPAGGG